MPRRITLLLLACVLLSGCGPEAIGEAETTAALEQQIKIPPALEDGFAICSDRIDVVLSPASDYGGFDMRILSHEPLTVEDIQVQIDGLEKLELILDEIDDDQYWTGQGAMEDYNWITPFNMFCCYQDIDWEEIDRLEAEIKKAETELRPNADLIAAQDAIYAPYMGAFRETQGAFPQFYVYDLGVGLFEYLSFATPAWEKDMSFTNLLVTVKGKTVDLSDRFSLQYTFGPGSPVDGPLVRRGGPVSMGIPVNANGSYSTPGPILYYAEEDVTVTDIGFWKCDTSRLISVEFTSQTTGINQKWDGETPIEIAAGDTVEVMVKAEDPLLADMIAGSIDRVLRIEYTAQGEQYTKITNMHFLVRSDPFTLYAHAQGALLIEQVRSPED